MSVHAKSFFAEDIRLDVRLLIFYSGDLDATIFGITEVVRLKGFSGEKMTDSLLGPQKSCLNNEVVERRGITVFGM